MKRIPCHTLHSDRQIELTGIPTPTLKEQARGLEVKLATAIVKALAGGWTAAKRSVRKLAKPEPVPQLDFVLLTRPLTKQEQAEAWLREHAAELAGYDCDTLDARPIVMRTHDGEGAHPVEAVDGLEYIGDYADPLALLVEAETLAETDFDAYVDAAAERARLEDDRKQRTPETTLRRALKKAAAKLASGQIGFCGAGWSV